MLQTASRLVLVAGAVALGAAGSMALRADLMIAYGFSRALEARQTAPAAFEVAATASQRDKAEVGDETYWLARGGGMVSPVVLGKPLAVGDRIAMTTQDGHAHHLEVVAISEARPAIHRVADGPLAAQLTRVTLRTIDTAGRNSGRLVHVWIEAEAPKPAGVPPSQAALGPT